MERYIGYACLEGADTEQLAALKAAGATTILANIGCDASWSHWRRILGRLQPGDILVVWKSEVLGFSAPNLIRFMGLLSQQGIRIKSLSEDWLNTVGPHGGLIMELFAALDDDHQVSGQIPGPDPGIVAQPKRSGAPGRPSIMSPGQVADALRRQQAGESVTRIAAALGVGRMTVTRALAKARAAAEGLSSAGLPGNSAADQVAVPFIDEAM
ncbi:MAG: helix-turn-helix domain-containing protein [Renibacterium sp.]|nr:helix-turn-helix domain-containing protein [Renibacterium sp.]